ncbi:MAG: hypothetical protein K1Y36_08590 [Blastocatellia bacterium]|nr:hypothetical protein [Blastocatellia bacterium]
MLSSHPDSVRVFGNRCLFARQMLPSLNNQPVPVQKSKGGSDAFRQADGAAWFTPEGVPLRKFGMWRDLFHRATIPKDSYFFGNVVV